MYDVIVAGGGVIGTSVLAALSHIKIKTLLLEKEEDVSCGCSKANSGIVHAGYDAEEGTLKARFNVRGAEMYPELCRKFHVPYKNTGSLVLAPKDRINELEKLYERGIKNGVSGLEIVEGESLKKLEPNIAEGIEFGLYAPTAGIVSPYGFTIAQAQHAIINGAEILTEKEIVSVSETEEGFSVGTADGSEYKCRVFINCAGYGSKEISDMLGEELPPVSYKRGDYIILDRTEHDKFRHTCFPLPDENGKGILVSPTADGNVILGPTGFSVDSGTDTAVAEDGLALIRSSVPKMMRNVDFRKGIRVFAGVRCSSGRDFVIGNGKSPDYIYLQGICSPGLTAAPAIAEYVAEELLGKTSLKADKKDEREIKYLPARPITRDLSVAEWQELARKNPEYAVIVCRCERITEGEILDVLREPLPPKSADALKRRVRTSMGRCQGGFCTPRVMEILADFYGLPPESVTKCGKGSEIVTADVIED